MKIRLDECIANRIARAIVEITANRPGYEVSYVQHGQGGTDPDWMNKFAAESGTAIVSGDHNILQHWPNLVAYTESGLISFFPPPAYQHLNAYGRASFILRWWPAIVEKVKISQKGDRWRLPMHWTQIDHTQMEALRDPRFDGPNANAKPTTQAKQSDLPLEGPETSKPPP